MWVRNRNKEFEEAASKTHEHDDYAAKTHSHSEYANSNHTHIMYMNKSDFAVVTKSGVMLYGVGGGAIISYPNGFNKDNCTILAVEFCPDGDGGGYKGRLINYKYLMYAGLTDNSIQFGYHDISGTNSDEEKLTGTIRIILMKPYHTAVI